MIGRKYALILYFFSFQLIHAAEEQSCRYCRFIGYLNDVYFGVEETNFFCDQFNPVPQGTLVMVETEPGCFQRAIVLTDSSDQDKKIAVHLCNNHELIYVLPSDARSFKPLWQLNWQPIPPIASTKNLIRQFLTRYTQRGARIVTMLIPATGKLSIIGDLHGAVMSFLSIINGMEKSKKINSSLQLAPDNFLVPLGDFGDREPFGVEVWHYLLLLMLINERVIPLRGNHELIAMAIKHGFSQEWQQKIGESSEDYNNLEQLFSSLPHALLVGFKHSIAPFYRFLLICHGGINLRAPIRDAMKRIIRKYEQQKSLPVCEAIPLAHREGEYAGYLWNEFVADALKNDKPRISQSVRGAGISAFNTSMARLYIHSQHSDFPETESCRLDAVICGHAQYLTGIAKLRDQIERDSYWKQIRPGKNYQVRIGDVFTCNASNKSCYRDKKSSAAGCFSTFMPNADGSWHVTPYGHDV